MSVSNHCAENDHLLGTAAKAKDHGAHSRRGSAGAITTRRSGCCACTAANRQEDARSVDRPASGVACGTAPATIVRNHRAWASGDFLYPMLASSTAPILLEPMRHLEHSKLACMDLMSTTENKSQVASSRLCWHSSGHSLYLATLRLC